jgi:ABC-2 type transport system permease protein
VTPLLAGYAGMALLGVAFIACGTAASTITENQVVAALLTYAVLVFRLVRELERGGHRRTARPGAAPALALRSLLRLRAGVIDSRDVVYLLAFAAFFLFLALRSLGARSWRGV